MSERRKYKVIVSDRAKQMLGVHIRFLAQVDKDATRNKKKELMEAMRSLTYSPKDGYFFQIADGRIRSIVVKLIS